MGEKTGEKEGLRSRGGGSDDKGRNSGMGEKIHTIGILMI